MKLSSQRRISSCFRPPWCATAFIAIVGALVVMATVGSSWAQPVPQSAEVTPGGSAAQAEAIQAIQEFWTPERMKNAVPPPPHPSLGAGAPATLSESPLREAAPGFAPGRRPRARHVDPTMQYDAIPGGGVLPQTSPPFLPPGFPTDFNNYAPFQRWTWLGKYVNYPISTIGKLFFTQQFGVCAGGCVCSASVIGLNTLATAGHCVHDGSSGGSGWSFNILFCPSYNQGGVNPARGCWAGVLPATSGNWFFNGNFDRDYGCIVTATTGSLIADSIGNVTGWTGRAWNYPTRQLEVSFGYPQAPPFAGNIIISTASTEWYELDIGPGDGQVSKYIGNDQTGGSSGGPWWLNVRAGAAEVADTDASDITDPAQGQCCPWINGVNSHKRCSIDCMSNDIYTQEMGSPPFRNTGPDGDESEDLFALCYANGG